MAATHQRANGRHFGRRIDDALAALPADYSQAVQESPCSHPGKWGGAADGQGRCPSALGENQFGDCVGLPLQPKQCAPKQHCLRCAALADKSVCHAVEELARCWCDYQSAVDQLDQSKRKMWVVPGVSLQHFEPVGKRFCRTIGLSDKDTEIWEMLVNGMNTKSIALSIRWSPKTVEYYRARLFKKFKVNNVVHLTRLAYHYGLLKP